jgi:uncharacterized sporulation protein YeaH/YhbH (DUF444 family)
MNYANILIRKYPDTKWVFVGDAYDGLDWLDDSPKPSKKALEALWPEVQMEVQTEQVERARANAYRETADPMFFRYQAGEATEQEWLDARQAVRDAHPYPEVNE